MVKIRLHISVERGHEDIVTFLLQAGVSANVLESTSLLYAMERVINDKAPLDITKCLIKAGANVTNLYTASNLYGVPLAVAVAVGHHALVELLQEAPGDGNFDGSVHFGWGEKTPIYAAVAMVGWIL